MLSLLKKYLKKQGAIKSYRIKWLTAAILLWTLFDIYIFERWELYTGFEYDEFKINKIPLVIIWIAISIALNFILGWLLFYIIPKIKEKNNAVLVRLAKIVIVFSVICVFSIFRYLVLLSFSPSPIAENIFHASIGHAFFPKYLVDVIFMKSLVVIIMQLIYQVGQKYTPGFFLNMLLGTYSSPRTEKRTIMFIDLKDSTPISEQLGHEKYFLFIRDFIYTISNAALQCGGDIYQYVGDEVIVTWPKAEENNMKCIQTLILARKAINKRLNYFKQEYGIVPEFRAGIHLGEITVGEIGVVKKDLAMSGEAMNTTARIRSACSELNQKYIVSEDYFDFTNLKGWQGQDLGEIQLKGIEKRNVKLYGLKI